MLRDDSDLFSEFVTACFNDALDKSFLNQLKIAYIKPIH